MVLQTSCASLKGSFNDASALLVPHLDLSMKHFRTPNSTMIIHPHQICRQTHIFPLHIFHKDSTKVSTASAQYLKLRFSPQDKMQHKSSIPGSGNISNCAVALACPPYARDSNSIHPTMSILISLHCTTRPRISKRTLIPTLIPLRRKLLHFHVMPLIMMHIPKIPIHNAILRDPAPLVRIIFPATIRHSQGDNRPPPNHLFSNLIPVRRVAGRSAICKLMGRSWERSERTQNESPVTLVC